MNRSTTILSLAGAAALAVVPAASAVAAPGGAAHQAKITNLSVSHQHLSSAGGEVTLSVKTAHAKLCKFTLRGLSGQGSSSHVVHCASRAHVKAYIPANIDSSAAAKYKVSVVALAHGHVHASSARSAVISVAKGQPTPPPPGVGGGGTPPPPPGTGGGELPPPPPGGGELPPPPPGA